MTDLIQRLRRDSHPVSDIIPVCREAADRIEELEAAIERMRVAGGSQEFQMAFELAKDLL